MKCSEAAESVSALFDGEPLSREAAAHLSHCEECRARLNDYAEMGAELRDVASASWPQTVPQGQWKLAEPAPARNWLGKWRGTMRIPKFAFALMLVGLLTFSLSTGMFLTRATNTSGWFAYEVLGRDGKMIEHGAVRTNAERNPYYDADGGMTYEDGIVWFQVRWLEQVGDRERIGVRALWSPKGDHSEDPLQRMHGMPEQAFVYSPGQDLKIPVDGYGNLEIKGHFEAHLPEDLPGGLYPGDGKFRIDPPVLFVSEKQMLGKFIGGGGELWLDNSYFAYGQQDAGWFLFSAKPFAGAIEGTLTMNEIEFQFDGKHYSLFTGDPIVFGRVKIWVKHFPTIQDFDPNSSGIDWAAQKGSALAFGELKNLVVEGK